MGAIISGVQGLRNGRIVFKDESPASMATVVSGNLNDIHVADHGLNVSLDSNENEHWRCRALEVCEITLLLRIVKVQGIISSGATSEFTSNFYFADRQCFAATLSRHSPNF